MDTFDVVVMIGGACGLLMVVGGMILLYKGAITLNQASPEAAVALEFKKTLKITTHYPALGLFIIGLAFIVTSVWYSKPEVYSVKLVGQVLDLDPEDVPALKVYGGPWERRLRFTDGTIKEIINPNLEVMTVEILAPGYDPIRVPIEKKDLWLGTASLGKLRFKSRKVADRPPENPDNIETPDEPLPALDAPAGF
jgi:hypothetical protein